MEESEGQHVTSAMHNQRGGDKSRPHKKKGDRK
jgi:hypothetical protein